MKMPRVSIAAIAVAATLASGASALADELQVFCAGSTSCVTGGANVVTTNQTPTFGFLDTGGPATGNLFIDFLVPTNLGPTGPTLTPFDGTSSTLTGTATKITPASPNTQPWSSSSPDKQLGPFQFGSGAPNGNPISALGNGGPFFVYSLEFTNITLNKTAGAPDWTSSTLPLFTVIIAFLDTTPSSTGGPCTNG